MSAVERLQRLLAQRDDVQRRVEAEGDANTALATFAGQVAERLGGTADLEPSDLAHQLQASLTAADRAEEAARAATGEIDRLQRDEARLLEAQAAVDGEASALRTSLSSLCAPDEPDPLMRVQRRIDAHARADRLQEELEQARPDLAHVQARIELARKDGATWVMSDQELAKRRTQLQELRDRIEGLVGRAEALDTEIGHLRHEATVDAVDSDILALQEEEKRLVTHRDRAWLMAQLLREADRSFREEHQPDLLRRASEYLERLTAGRYHRLLVDELGDGDLFQIVGPGLPRPIPLARPISTGTLEQAYLSLRLAIVDHLDRGSERLPLFIDEALVNWDTARRERGLEVLAELSNTRQVFTFTCHPAMADRLEAHGAHVLRMER